MLERHNNRKSKFIAEKLISRSPELNKDPEINLCSFGQLFLNKGSKKQVLQIGESLQQILVGKMHIHMKRT
jgi:hypothetical protein